MTGSQRGDGASVCVRGSGTHARSVDGTDLSALLAILGRVMAVCNDDLDHKSDRESVGRWEDDHYVYFGACLPGTGRDIVISVHEGRFMVRLAKLAEDSDSD
jgi:hypothetical protein